MAMPRACSAGGWFSSYRQDYNLDNKAYPEPWAKPPVHGGGEARICAPPSMPDTTRRVHIVDRSPLK
eukprot:gene7130-6745_t